MKARYLTVALILAAGVASAQINLTPRTISIEELKCSALLSLSGEQQDRVLIYLNGYFDGMRKAKTWDESLTGRRIDEAIARCQANPARTVLDVFGEVWPR